MAEFRDKMQGAWLGQMIGVGWGAPTEFKVKGEIIPEDKFPAWKPEMINQHGNDDLYVEMTFLRTLELYGFDVSIRQAGIDFANSSYKLWHANKAGRDNLRAGIAPPDSGHPQFNKHADDIDYQIEADFSGIIAPGLPNLVIALGEKFGRLMNYGDGVYAGQFVGGMYAEAYFERDPRKLVEAGLRCIPPESQYAEMVRDLLKWCRENADWTKTWQLVEEKYHKDPRYTHGLCSKPGGAGAFSIDAKLNGAYIIMGLLYGGGNLEKTIAISCRCGQDSDCNPSNAAGVLMTALGASKIPQRFTEKLDLARKFSFTDYTLPQVYEVSEKLARQAILRAGGRIVKDAQGNEVFLIPVQKPKPSPLEQSRQPAPIANARFTPEEMAKIRPPPETPHGKED
ncbi:MAG: ADP-ribosylglycohydrolase family protein [Candidatus Sumerlaeia bacterium]|nr:ADP-ribosylglycohydrolase family protein [Candidatus Sumerlaeia bacterium]